MFLKKNSISAKIQKSTLNYWFRTLAPKIFYDKGEMTSQLLSDRYWMSGPYLPGDFIKLVVITSFGTKVRNKA